MHGACSKCKHCIKSPYYNSSVRFMVQAGHHEDYIRSPPHKRSNLRHSDSACHFSHLNTFFTLRSNMVFDTRIWFTVHGVSVKVVVMPVEASGIVSVPLSTVASIPAASLWLHWLISREWECPRHHCSGAGMRVSASSFMRHLHCNVFLHQGKKRFIHTLCSILLCCNRGINIYSVAC